MRRLLAGGHSQASVARKLQVHRMTLAAFIKKEKIPLPTKGCLARGKRGKPGAAL